MTVFKMQAPAVCCQQPSGQLGMAKIIPKLSNQQFIVHRGLPILH